MKNILFTIVALAGASLPGFADAPGHETAGNYVRTTVYNTGGVAAYDETRYFDGLGRPVETVKAGFTPDGKDMVSIVDYNATRGQAERVWLPVPTAVSTGEFVPVDTVRRMALDYHDDTAPYVLSVYEESPLGRVERQYKPGEVFHDNEKFVESTYDPCYDGEFRQILFSNGHLYVSTNTSQTGKFFKTTVRNEDGVTTTTFKDRSGKLILSRTGEAQTHYVYDALGRLAVVVTPEGAAQMLAQVSTPVSVNSELVRSHCFYYEYDGFGNLTMKQTPGGAREQMVYDEKGRLWRHWKGATVETTPGVFEKYFEEYTYDSLNRVTEVWIKTAPFTPDISDQLGYEVVCTLLTKYDDYNGAPTSLRAFATMADTNHTPRGLKTYECSMIVGNNADLVETAAGNPYLNEVERAFFYDDRSQLVRMAERNQRGGVSLYEYEYDVQGRLTRRMERIQVQAGATADVLTVAYGYDRTGRQTTEYTVLNGVTSSLRVNTYNELGQLREQITDHVTEHFDYNLQGWRTVHTANHARAGAEDVFSSSLHYYDPEHGTTPSYSGNISEWTWSGCEPAQTYAFDYDEMGRLDGTIHRDQTPGSINRFTERAQYDLNGNIVSLSRTSDGATSDLMFYHYAGGRLTSVDGLAPATFEHDLAGNMTSNGYDDLEIQYNLLNLPSQITDSGNADDTVTNCYSVTGQKVSSVDGDGNGVLYVGSLVYGVRPGAISLESAPFAGGRFFAVQGATGVKYALQYHVTDHLGSVRVVLDRDGNVLEQNDYYPFGKRWEDAGSPNSTNRYKYNGKELAASRLLDYGARYYSPGLGRWMSVEPLADFFPSQSVYAMCFNNPIRYVDRFGLSPDEPTYYGGEIEGVVCIGYRPDQSMPRYSWDWGGYDEWLEKMYSSFYGVGGGGVSGGGGRGGGGGSPTNPDGTDVVTDIKEVNDVVDPALQIINRATENRIGVLVKAGNVTTAIGVVTVVNDATSIYDATENGKPVGWPIYNTTVGVVGQAGLPGAIIAFVVDIHVDFAVWFSEYTFRWNEIAEERMMYGISGYGWAY